MTDCARCHSALEAGDLRCPVCALAQPTAPEAHSAPARVLRCNDCRATLRYSEEFAKTVCGFCGAALELELSTDPLELAEAWVPFTVTREHAKSSLKVWLGQRGFFAPTDLVEGSQLQSLRPMAFAAWFVTGSSTVTYGTDVFGAGSRAPWGPRTGQFSQALELLVPATRALTLEEVVDLGPYEVETAQPEPLNGVAGEDFGVTRTTARSRILEGVRDDAIAELSRAMGGKKLKRTKVDVMLEGLRTRRLLLPVWVLAYRYGNQKYRVVIHGRRGQTVVGRSPISPTRVLLAVLAALGLVAVLVAFLALYARAG